MGCSKCLKLGEFTDFVVTKNATGVEKSGRFTTTFGGIFNALRRVLMHHMILKLKDFFEIELKRVRFLFGFTYS